MFSSQILIALGFIFAVLIGATLFFNILNTKSSSKELQSRITSWWIIISLFTIGVFLNNTLAMIFFALLSYLALKEYFSLIPTRLTDRRIIFYAYISIIFQYIFSAIKWYGMFIIWIPVYLFLFLPFRQILIGDTKGFLEHTSRIQWGLMMFVFGLSHMAYLLTLDPVAGKEVGGKELLLYLVFLTQFNDVMQYVFGKKFGKRKIIPKVSPNKTVEGFFYALLTTTVLAYIFSFLTPFLWYQALFAGALIAVAGFIGDVVISMVKRDIGVKDSGNLLPGHGGILDRVDSLTYSAPLFFHYVYYLYY